MQSLAQQSRKELTDFDAEFATRMSEWENALKAGKSGQWQAAAEDTLRRWREQMQRIRSSSQMLESQESPLDELERLISQIMEEKGEVQKLGQRASTRATQADSLNPKVRPSPYVNILGLQRTFRDSTRLAIIIISGIFGALALAVLTLIVLAVIPAGGFVSVGGGTGGFLGFGTKRYMSRLI